MCYNVVKVKESQRQNLKFDFTKQTFDYYKISMKRNGSDQQMKLSNVIEDFIKEMLALSGGEQVELQRNALADKFSCVPSQINYVISTRFSPERGFLVESRRGGGGYIKITRVTSNEDMRIMHVVNAVGDSISYASAVAMIKNCYDYDLLSKKEAKIMISAVSDNSLPINQPLKDYVRAKILKNMLVSVA